MAQVATPTFSPNGGEASPGDTFTIACATGGSTIYYTYDPVAVPSPLTWTEYTDAIELDTSVEIVVRAYAIKSGSDDSEVAEATFQTQVAAPVFDPAGGKVAVGDSFELDSDTNDADIYYSFGDSPPSTDWEEYTAAVDIPADASGQTVTVRAYAVKDDLADSEVTVVNFYTIGYSAAVSATAKTVLDTAASQGLGAATQGIATTASDNASISGWRIGASTTTTDLKAETNA